MLTRATLNLPVCARCAVHVLVRVLVLVLYVNVKVHKCVHVRVSQPVDWWDGQRGQRRGAQLDGEFAFERRRLRAWSGGGGGCAPGKFAHYASRSRLRAWSGGGGGGALSWTGSLPSPPTLGGGALSWTGSLLSTPLAADFGPGSIAAEGHAAGREIFIVCFSPPTSGLVRRGRRGGALPLRGVRFSIFHSLAFAMLTHWSQDSQHHLRL